MVKHTLDNLVSDCSDAEDANNSLYRSKIKIRTHSKTWNRKIQVIPKEKTSYKRKSCEIGVGEGNVHDSSVELNKNEENNSQNSSVESTTQNKRDVLSVELLDLTQSNPVNDNTTNQVRNGPITVSYGIPQDSYNDHMFVRQPMWQPPVSYSSGPIPYGSVVSNTDIRPISLPYGNLLSHNYPDVRPIPHNNVVSNTYPDVRPIPYCNVVSNTYPDVRPIPHSNILSNTYPDTRHIHYNNPDGSDCRSEECRDCQIEISKAIRKKEELSTKCSKMESKINEIIAHCKDLYKTAMVTEDFRF